MKVTLSPAKRKEKVRCLVQINLKKRYILCSIGVLIVLVFTWSAFNVRWLWRDYITPPPVNFLENEEIFLALYPEGYSSASVFTNEGVSANTPLEKIRTLRIRLMNMGVRGTFFVIPFSSGRDKLTSDLRQMWELRKLQDFGFEIAQNGCFYYSPTGSLEMPVLSPEQELKRIRQGRMILEELGFEISGYRSPGLEGTKNTPLILEQEGYLYGSDFRAPPLTLRTLFFPGFRGSVIYPYHMDGLNLLEVACQAEPVIRPGKARRRFEKIHRQGGVFVFRTELPRVRKEENLKRLQEFIDYLQDQDTWLCTLRELCRWWLAREKINIVTRLDGDNLDIIYDNSTPFSLKNANITFKAGDESLRTYRILNTRGDIIAAGFIPDSLCLQVTLFPYIPGEAKNLIR